MVVRLAATLALVIVFAPAAGAAPAASDKTAALKALRDRLIGKPAPTLDGSTIVRPRGGKLDGLRGKVLVIEFWATWCAPCVKVVPRLNAWDRTYRNRGLRVLGISNEAARKVLRFVSTHKIDFTIATIGDDRLPDAYQIQTIPFYVVIDRDGVVRYVDFGADATLDRIERAFLPLLDPDVAVPLEPR